jgi:hypothetical protein
MSLFGRSASDIIAAIQIAHNIWDTWFANFMRAGRASDMSTPSLAVRADCTVDAQYLDFGKDVAQFGNLLERFFSTFENASQTQLRHLSASKFKEWDAQACRERQEVVGSFADTLEECYLLLQQNASYLSKSLQVWDNARWHLRSSSDAAERLRGRLQLHAAKVFSSHIPLW